MAKINGAHEHFGLITPTEVRELVLKGMPGSKVEVRDMTGTSDHFEISVVSKSFEGKSLVEQHKLIFEILKPEMDSRIHAVKLKTRIA